MPTRNVPRFRISSSRDGCWACAEAATRRNVATRHDRTRTMKLLRRPDGKPAYIAVFTRCKDVGIDLQSLPAYSDFTPDEENRDRDYLNASIVRRGFYAISGQFVRSARPCGCSRRSAENRSLD